MSLNGTPTSLGIPTFADTDSPDLSTNGLTLALTKIDTLLRALVSHTEVTAPVSIAAGGPVVIVTAPAYTFDGTTVYDFDFYCNAAAVGTGSLTLTLYEDGAAKERLSFQPSAVSTLPVFVRARFAPAAGSHTYSVRGTSGAGTGNADAGNGLAGNSAPMFLRIAKAPT